MPTIELTAFNVKNLKANQTRVDYFDRKITGFGLRVSGSGRKTWFLSYRKSGIKKRYSMGTYPIMPLAEARDKAREVLLRIQMGNDPSQDKAAERRAPTAEYLVNEYIEKYAKLKKRSWKKDEAILRGKFLPFFKCTKIHEIHRRDINTFLDSLLTEGLTTQCNRVFEIVRRMFNFAIEQDIIQHSPCFMVKKRVPEKRRDRVLTPNEIQAVWKALSTENDSIRHVFGILLHTGQRP
ncbi:MAG: integrase arm-type DNA-binding domain-containing protein, partial [Lyngbya sp.]|nr:integrase arm-type DNA-binding domain-containing protein [Lyngbya sp.]